MTERDLQLMGLAIVRQRHAGTTRTGCRATGPLANRFSDSRVLDLASTCILNRREYRVVMHLGALIAIKAVIGVRYMR